MSRCLWQCPPGNTYMSSAPTQAPMLIHLTEQHILITYHLCWFPLPHYGHSHALQIHIEIFCLAFLSVLYLGGFICPSCIILLKTKSVHLWSNFYNTFLSHPSVCPYSSFELNRPFLHLPKTVKSLPGAQGVSLDHLKGLWRVFQPLPSKLGWHFAYFQCVCKPLCSLPCHPMPYSAPLD